MTAEETLSQQLSHDIASLRFEEIPTFVLESAKLHILDSLGCILSGSRLEPGKLAYDLAIAASGDISSAALVGTTRRVSYPDAVQAMATAAHCGELDDIHGRSGTCIGAVVVPALIATGEKWGGHGRDFLIASIVGYET